MGRAEDESGERERERERCENVLVSGGERGSGRKGERVWEEVKEKGGKEIEKELRLGEFGIGHVARGEMKRSSGVGGGGKYVREK